MLPTKPHGILRNLLVQRQIRDRLARSGIFRLKALKLSHLVRLKPASGTYRANRIRYRLGRSNHQPAATSQRSLRRLCFFAIAVLLSDKAILRVGPLPWGWNTTHQFPYKTWRIDPVTSNALGSPRAPCNQDLSSRERIEGSRHSLPRARALNLPPPAKLPIEVRALSGSVPPGAS
jgi:hypothetical protein